MEETQMEASQSLSESRVSHASGFLVRATQRGACAGDGDAGTPGFLMLPDLKELHVRLHSHSVFTNRCDSQILPFIEQQAGTDPLCLCEQVTKVNTPFLT
ncbi:hypothetical protein R3I93_009376 [Phoxinus phoxinus]|uniref:Uncharacterized protein n=1 Tax=Phoxinus phoxinus TaxID=58324 RepID=A0AAN9H7Q2_9TELE